MIIVRVELHSAITGKVTEIACMGIANIGGTAESGDYRAETWRGRSRPALAQRQVQRAAEVRKYPRLAIHVWHLVARSLVAMGYAGSTAPRQMADMFDAEVQP